MAEYQAAGTAEPRGLWWKQLGCICVSLVVLAGLLSVAVYLWLFRGAPLTISRETTYITGPLKPGRNEVDYFAAWERETYPENMATDENGYRLIVRRLGAAPDAAPAHAVQISHKLGMAAGESEPDLTFQELGDFLQGYVAGEDFDKALVEELAGESAPADPETMNPSPPDPRFVLEDRLGRPWTLDDLPMMEAWLAENGPAIDLIGEAVRKPTFHIPLALDVPPGELISLLLPEMQQTRSFARMLLARANYRIATGDVDGAIDDAVTCKRLGRLVGQGGPLVQVLVGIAIEGIADSIGVAGSSEHPATKKQLQRLVDELNDLPPRADLEKSLVFERYAALDALQTMARNNRFVLPTTRPSGLGLDWNVVARGVNEDFDTLLTTGGWSGPPQNLTPIVSLRARSEAAADAFSMYFVPAADAALEAWRRATCVDRVRRIALAMLLYERDQGTLPPACTVDADGKPLHSWRVLLLPYLGERELYEKIRLDEPWDSRHNRQLHNMAVPFYQCPSEEMAPYHTTYSVVVGPDAPFQAGEGKALSEFGPKGAHAILVVEGKQLVSWMDPTRDLRQGTAEASFNRLEEGGVGIGSRHPGGSISGHGDGSVRFLSETIGPEVLKRLLRGTAERKP